MPIYWFLLMVAIFAAWVAIIAYRPQFTIVATCGVLVLILALSAAAGFRTYRGYQQLGLPQQFLKAFLFSRSLRLLGAVALFIAFMGWLLHGGVAGLAPARPNGPRFPACRSFGDTLRGEAIYSQ